MTMLLDSAFIFFAPNDVTPAQPAFLRLRSNYILDERPINVDKTSDRLCIRIADPSPPE
jgi:hypothetical protein